MLTARAYVESGALGTGKRRLDDIQVNEKQDPPPFPIGIRPAEITHLDIKMTLQLTPEEEHTFFEQDYYNLILEVDIPQPQNHMYCISLGHNVVSDFLEKGTGHTEAKDPRCTSSDHP
jgi:hypothetical protein